jgi:hypothetical protein
MDRAEPFVQQEVSMGGLGGEIRAANREKLWEKFRDEVRPFVTDRFGLIEESPVTQKKAFDSMRFDSESGEWVLDYYFSK